MSNAPNFKNHKYQQMKYFKCGKCKAGYKMDDSKFTHSEVVVTCKACGSKNLIRLGPVLVAQSKDKVKQFRLKEGANTVGRASKEGKADIQIEDAYVSRLHATLQIEKREDKIYISIEDAKSTNGTYNKQKTRLKPGLKYPFLVDDYFIIGLTKISFTFN